MGNFRYLTYKKFFEALESFNKREQRFGKWILLTTFQSIQDLFELERICSDANINKMFYFVVWYDIHSFLSLINFRF
jgi:hypothetical protein